MIMTYGRYYHVEKTHTLRRDHWNTSVRRSLTLNKSEKVKYHINEKKTYKLKPQVFGLKCDIKF